MTDPRGFQVLVRGLDEGRNDAGARRIAAGVQHRRSVWTSRVARSLGCVALAAVATLASAQQAPSSDELTGATVQIKAGQRVGPRLNDRIGKRTRSLVTRISKSNTGQLEESTIQRDLRVKR